jgi:hypothetical protein
MIGRAICAAALSLLFASVGNAAPELTPSEILANAARYDGQHVTVNGYVVLGPETRDIFDSKAAAESAHSACLGLDAPDKSFTSFHKRYEHRLSGIFRRQLCGPKDICLFWCSTSGIELDSGQRP